MFERLIESGGAHPQPPLAPLMLSVFANATLAYGAATATRAPEASAPPERGRAEQVVYLLPPPPARVPFEQVGVRWVGGDGPGPFTAPLDAESLLAVEAGGDRGRGAGRRGTKARRDDRAADSLSLAGEFAGGTVYVASELDEPVAFDPSSAAPAYPPELQQAGIEGSATMRFVVDTGGQADTATIKVLAMTHAGFAAAVREALPHMRFRPALLADRRVRQLVEQQFKFRIELPAQAALPDSAAAAATPEGAGEPEPAPADSAP